MRTGNFWKESTIGTMVTLSYSSKINQKCISTITLISVVETVMQVAYPGRRNEMERQIWLGP
jgi:hypothetical protein